MVVNLDGAWLPKFVQSWVVAVLFHCILAMGDIKQSQHQPACDAGKGEVCSSLGQNLLQVKTATQRTRTDEIRVVNEVPITIDYADMEDGESFGDGRNKGRQRSPNHDRLRGHGRWGEFWRRRHRTRNKGRQRSPNHDRLRGHGRW